MPWGLLVGVCVCVQGRQATCSRTGAYVWEPVLECWCLHMHGLTARRCRPGVRSWAARVSSIRCACWQDTVSLAAAQAGEWKPEDSGAAEWMQGMGILGQTPFPGRKGCSPPCPFWSPILALVQGAEVDSKEPTEPREKTLAPWPAGLVKAIGGDHLAAP